MKKLFIIALSFWFLGTASCFSQDSDVKAAERLTRRLIPDYADGFVFEKASAKAGDYYTLESRDGKIVVRGNNANSMAAGLNYYLKYYCLTTVSWYADIPVEMPQVLPAVDKPVTVEAKVDTRFFLNYCTYGYSMPFWQWRDWERMIDWMALNGVNMPLAITGQESVWYKVWRKMGLTDEEIRSYFTGPVYLPWHRMANIDGWNGPLPMEWLESQTELQQKILARERELNMTPVLPAFAGHVPAALKRIYPEANIQYLGKWAGFSDTYRCHFLNPEEPLFAEIQKSFLQEQEKLFGTDHIYGVDPFNEVDPPSWDPKYLAQVSADMYKTLTAADPEAVWLQMTWMFYHDRDLWTAPRIKALLTGVPQDKMMLLDYHCENVELWKSTDKFHGQPYIWCYLGNFGGNTTLTGNVGESGRRLDEALKSGGDNLAGIGSTLEGLDIDQFPYEYIFEKAWNIAVDEQEWIDRLADRHVGAVSAPARKAWHLLYDDIFVQVPRTLGILPGFRPQLGNNHDKRTSNEYDNTILLQVWKLLLDVPACQRDAYNIDLVMVGRQLLGNYFLTVKREFDRLYGERNVPALQAKAAEMREILVDLEALNAFHSHASLDTWIDEARNMGTTDALKNYYEKNARNLITTWGGNLNDYASRTWAGLVKSYYAGRWEIYFDAVIAAAEQGAELDSQALNQKLAAFEQAWVESTDPVIIERHGTLLDTSRELLKKYEKKIGH